MNIFVIVQYRTKHVFYDLEEVMNRYYYKIFISIVICFCLTGCGGNADSNKEAEQSPNSQQEAAEELINGLEIDESGIIKRDESEDTENGSAGDNESSGESFDDSNTLEVHYLDIGQGDSILIKQGEAAMLIDAGNNDKGSTVWSYLLSQNVQALDYAIGTHPDADHIGGLDVVLYKLDCDTIFLPSCENDTKTYKELIQTIGQRNQKVMVPKRGDIYTLGEAQFQILTDTGKNYGNNTNDFSIVLRLTFGETSFLFTGDAEEEAEEDMLASGLNLSADVYKAAHHGADTANTEKFLQAVNPTYCVISCGEGNSYGHPRAGFLNNVRGMGVSVFRTDEQGTIVAVSDGKTVRFNCSPSTSWKAGEPVGSGLDTKDEGKADRSNGENTASQGNETFNDNSENASTQGQYVINTSTEKFHRPECSSVKKMADKNKQVSDKTKEELVKEGYEPCKNCNP